MRHLSSRFRFGTFGRHNCQGFTVVELLASVAIAALLMSLLGAAIMATRESARRMQCLSHLKQIGIATHSYEGLHGKLPCSGTLAFRYLVDGLEGRAGSWFTSSSIDPCMNGPCPEIGDWKRPPVYLCPSDPLTSQTRRAVSYRFSFGLESIGGERGVSDGFGWADFYVVRMISFRDVLDGLSTTAMTSEQLLAADVAARTPSDAFLSLEPGVAARDSLRYHWEIPTAFALPTGLDALIAACDTQFTVPQSHFGGGWFNERVRGYDHVRTPNTRSCYNPNQTANVLRVGALSPPTSLHKGGVNLLMCDGSARFVSNGIDSRVWRASGTRSGSESQTIPQ